ncbi:hypothetical protein T01_10905 [Trichinella spiralis]|uniref:Uncharacterized protein n=1 Tax=Trichinella spiralis TaxID=6334 RepID=A0A0V1AN74_TRISP|nr:hypothetical protein T01_10905 [Trichinella spiralis]
MSILVSVSNPEMNPFAEREAFWLPCAERSSALARNSPKRSHGKVYSKTFLKESDGLYEIYKIGGNKYEITAKRLFLHDFMDYFHCSRFFFFKTADDFLHLCKICRIVENSREPCTPPSQR